MSALEKSQAAAERYRREVVGIFNSAESLEAAISELESAGWDRAELSLLGQKSVLTPEAVKDAPVDDIADDSTVTRDAVICDDDIRQSRTLAAGMAGVVAAFLASGAAIMTGGSALAAVIGAAAAGGGATVAIDAIGKMLAGNRASFFEEQVRHGGIVLWVALRSPDREPLAKKILARSGAVAVHVHDAGVGRVEPPRSAVRIR